MIKNATIQDFLYTTPIEPKKTVVKKQIIPFESTEIGKALQKQTTVPYVAPQPLNTYKEGNYTTFDYIKDNLSKNIIEPITKPLANPLEDIIPSIDKGLDKIVDKAKEILEPVKNKADGVIKNLGTKVIYIITGLVVLMLITNKK